MKFISVVAVAAGLFSGMAAADTLYVGGTLHTLAKSDFVQSGNNYTAYIDVIGDHGQQLVFDIDGTVGGQGYQGVTYRQEIRGCNLWENNVKGRDYSTCLVPNYVQVPVYSNEFRYVAELQVTCNGIAIGSDMDDKNALVNGKVSNEYREVKLLVSNRRTTGGYCQQLKVLVKGLELDSISNISLDVLVGETF
ncbi:hypothetical protein SG34_000220 [Thalassomonas viridans]|uniref:Uncharacterized protein n=1 Tax=Thalassomonas viridans TaxID=137584 RepID=A0AAF0C946_9GAMM|nr:hypothetical protein [Thalassomonas viridans]WDE05413.1 hypothetical protein SG34_000220 [Thalassomonas viridans]